MAVFGGYETVRELYRSGLASSSTARKAGTAGPAEFVVKTYQPPAGDASSEQARQEIEAFLSGARAQQRAAGAQHWAVLREVGQFEGGAYLVTDYHRRSIQHLIRGRVKLDGRGLHRLLSEIVRGLIEFRDACSRSHGNLKPTNVLLAGRGDVSRAKVLLTDPAGPDQLDARQGNVPDLHALGELIYQLVLHRPGRAMGGWPAPEAAEWTRLGRKGDEWRQLCNRLLNPNLAPGLLTLEDLAGDLAKLREGGGVRSKRVLVPVAAVFVLVAAVLGDYAARGREAVAPRLLASIFPQGNGTNGPDGKFDPAKWQELCRTWSGWVDALLVERADRRLDAWEKDPYLKKEVTDVLDVLLERSRDLSPRKIANRPYLNLNLLAGEPPDEAKTEQAVQRTAEALGMIRRLEVALGAEKWPAYVKTGEAAAAFEARRWKQPAEYLQSIRAPSDQDVPKRIHALLAVQAVLGQIDAHGQALTKLAKELSAWGAPSLTQQRLEEYFATETASAATVPGREGLTALRDKLAELLGNGPAKDLKDFVEQDRRRPPGQRVDMAMVRRKAPFQGPRLTDRVLRQGLAQLGGFRRKPDPRVEPWPSRTSDRLAQITGDLRSLGEKMTALLAEPKLAAKHRTALASVQKSLGQRRTELDALRARFASVRKPAQYTFDTQQAIDRGMGQIAADLGRIPGLLRRDNNEVERIRGEHIRTIRVGYEEYVKTLQNETRISQTGLAGVDATWRDQVKRLIQTDKSVETLQKKADHLRSFLRGLEGGLAEDLGAKLENRPWNKPLLETKLEEQRRGVLQSILSYVNWDAVLAGRQQQDASFVSRKAQAVRAYNEWRADMANAVRDFNQIQTLLAAGYRLDEKPAPSGPSLGELHARQRQSPLYRADIAATVAPMVARLNRLEEVEKLTDPILLLAAVAERKEGHFEQARSAWGRLTKLSRPWPNAPGELRQELAAQKNLSATYALLKDKLPAREAALQKELADEGRRRWLAYLLGRSKVAEIDDAIARMGEFGVKRTALDALPALAQYRVLMHEFRGRVSPSAGSAADDAIKTAVGQFQTSLRALPATLARSGPVTTLLAQLEPIRTATGQTVDLSKAGPALAGWSKTGGSNGTATYSKSGLSQRLTFVRVTPSGPGAKSCYLLATEVPVGLFIAVVEDAQKRSEIIRLMGNVEDPREGPRVWVVEGGRIRLPSMWLVDTPLLEGKHYPGRKPPDPEARHPMQQISLAAAIYFARLLGCRLPTAAEWQAAYDLEQKTPGAPTPNLRDQTWAIQQAFAVKLETEDRKAGSEFYPDAAIFWPRGTTDRKEGQNAVVLQQNDGVLWFAPVGSQTGRVFHHVMGNVAEYVYEKPDDLRQLTSPTPASLLAFVKTGIGSARVIGGSAMSAPSVPRDKPLQLEPMAGVPTMAVDGFSDVGFRLAFYAGKERLQVRLWRLLTSVTNEGYLSPTGG
jgi:hypothetical protein